MFDVAIIGAGVCGCAIAYELSKYNLNIALIEKENDVACGTTRANSAIIHAGYDPQTGTLMQKLNVRGSKRTGALCKQLSVQYRQIGSMVLAFDETQMQTLRQLCARGKANGVEGVTILTKEQAVAKEPNLSNDIVGALHAPTCAIISPWEFALALGEVAVKNGAKLFLNSPVAAIAQQNGGFAIQAGEHALQARFIVNAAGLFADGIHTMAGGEGFGVYPVKGQYYLLDKNQGSLVDTVIFQCPTKEGKGVLVAPTVHGNLIVGPDSAEIGDKADFSTSYEGLELVRSTALKSVPGINFRESIRNFAGLRAYSTSHDFIIEPSAQVKNFINVAGIKSPGLSSAAAIGEYVAELLAGQGLALTENPAFNGSREVIRFHALDHAGRAEQIARDARYGRIICRCETITEGEILDAIHSPIPPCSIDGVKRRTGAGMGRCQGGFCGPRIHELLARELGCDSMFIPQDIAGSYIITGKTKGEV